MNCATHTDTPASAFCRTCGKALCENCKRDVMGAIYCEPCIAARLQNPAVPGQPVAPVALSSTPSPGVAMLLGFIPGVGAMYNGQFMKAFIHVVIFVMAIVAASKISGVFGVLIAFWVFYMAFDAYKTAEAIRLGLPLPDPLGLDRLFGLQEHQPRAVVATPGTPVASGAVAQPQTYVVPPDSGNAPATGPDAPVGAIVLIALGVLFLLGSRFDVGRFWPLILIGVGLWLAYKRTIAVRG